MPSPVLKELLQHTAALRALARDLVGEASADDLLQDTAIQAITAPPRRPGPAGGWLATVVRRLAGKHRRAERLRAAHESRAARTEAQPADRGAEDADTLRRLTEIVASLPEPYRGTLLARYLRDRAPQQIAAETGTPVRTVKTRLQRGLRLLRERLAERDPEWRPMLVAAFGLERAIVSTTAATTTLLMSTTTKIALAGAAVLLTGFLAWQFATQRAAPTATQTATSPPTDATATRPAADAAPERAPDPGARTVVPDPTAARSAAPADMIVVHAVDAATGAPVERFALRAVVAPDQNLMAPENPRLHEGMHPDGRLVLPASALEQRVFQLEDSEHRWLPSRWFALADAVERDGERTIEVRMPAPVEVELTVVHEHGRAPVAGTKVELVRPWIASPEVTLTSNVQPSDRFRARLEVPPGWVQSLGSALLLSGATTDEAGRVRLLAPPDEPLALRLLGPGHRPTVRNQWIVPAGDSPRQIVEAVVTGAAIRGRALPIETLQQLRVELPEPGKGVSPQMLANHATGLRLRHKKTGESIPPGGFPFAPSTPIAADGTFAIDGLHAGDWQVLFTYPLRVQDVRELDMDPRMASLPAAAMVLLANVQVELPSIDGLADHELRVVDFDVSRFLPGGLQATVTRDGRRPEGDGSLLYQPIAELDAPLPHVMNSHGLRFDKSGRIVANLPPARYSARWMSSAPKADFPLPDFDIRSGVTTHVDLLIDAVPAQFRVVEADGVSLASGLLQLGREGRSWTTQASTDAGGLAVFGELPRDMPLRAAFRRPLPPGTEPGPGTFRNGRELFGDAIDLGTVTATGERAQPQVLRIPPR